MKKIIIALMLLGAICANTFAQEYDIVEVGEEVNFNHNEVYLTAGMPSFLGLFSGMFVAIFEGIGQAASNSGNSNNSGNSAETKKSNDVAFSLTGGYNYFFNENFGIGAFASYEKFSSLQLITLQAKVTGQYGWEHFKIYHAVSGGVLIVPEGGVNPIFDVTVLGLKADFERFNIFVEGSFPSTAILKAGASFKF